MIEAEIIDHHAILSSDDLLNEIKSSNRPFQFGSSKSSFKSRFQLVSRAFNDAYGLLRKVELHYEMHQKDMHHLKQIINENEFEIKMLKENSDSIIAQNMQQKMQFEESMRILQSELAMNQRNIAEIKNELDIKNNELLQNEHELEEMRNYFMQKLQCEQTMNQTNIAETKQELEMKNNELLQQKHELEEMKNFFIAENMQNIQQKRQSEEIIRELKDDLSMIQINMSMSQINIAEREKELKIKKTQLTEKEHELEKVKKKYKDTKMQLEKVEEENYKINLELSNLQAFLAVENRQLSESLDATNVMNRKLQTKNQILYQYVDEYMENMQDLLKQMRLCEVERIDLNGRYNEASEIIHRQYALLYDLERKFNN